MLIYKEFTFLSLGLLLYVSMDIAAWILHGQLDFILDIYLFGKNVESHLMRYNIGKPWSGWNDMIIEFMINGI